MLTSVGTAIAVVSLVLVQHLLVAPTTSILHHKEWLYLHGSDPAALSSDLYFLYLPPPHLLPIIRFEQLLLVLNVLLTL